MSTPSISASRDIAAPAERIFAILSRPARHPDVDGAGMLRAAPDDTVLSQIGDAFLMDMHNDEMGDYVMENRVVAFEEGRRLAWEPVLHATGKPELQSDVGRPGHVVWGWDLEPLGPHATRVTESFDCSRSPDWLRSAVREGERWRPAMVASLDNLAALVEER